MKKTITLFANVSYYHDMIFDVPDNATDEEIKYFVGNLDIYDEIEEWDDQEANDRTIEVTDYEGDYEIDSVLVYDVEDEENQTLIEKE